MSGKAVISFLLIGFLLVQCCYAKSIFKETAETSLAEATDNPNSSDQAKSSEEPVSFEQVDPPDEVFSTEQNEALTEQEGSTEEAVTSDEDESTNGKVICEIDDSSEETTSPAAEEEGEEKESNTTGSEREESSEKSEPNEQTESTEETTSTAAEEEGEVEESNTTESEQEESSEKSEPNEQTELTESDEHSESEDQVPDSESKEVILVTAAYYLPNVTETLSEGQKILKRLVKEMKPTTGEYESLESWFYRDHLTAYDRKINELRNDVKKSYSEDVNLVIEIFDQLVKFDFSDEDAEYRSESDNLIRDTLKEANFFGVRGGHDLMVKQVFYDFDDKFNKYWNSQSPSQQEFQKPMYELYQILKREDDFIEKMKIFKAFNRL